MRVYSRELIEIGALERHRQPSFPGAVEYSSTEAGRALLKIAEIHRHWLQKSPAGPIALGSTASRSATKALVEGWTTNIIRAFAAKPLSLTDLSRLIPKVSYPSLERRLAALRLADLVEPCPGPSRGTPYRPTLWLRRAVVPLAAGAWWERRYLTKPPQIGRFDVETAFLLLIPILDLPSDLNGKCRLSVELQGSSPTLAGVTINIKDGEVASCSSRLKGDPDGWAIGSPRSWIRRMYGQDGDLDVGGDAKLAREIVDSIRKGALSEV